MLVEELGWERFIGVPSEFGGIEILVPANSSAMNYIEDFAVDGDLVYGDIKSVDQSRQSFHVYFVLDAATVTSSDFQDQESWLQYLEECGVSAAGNDPRWR